MIFVWKLIDAYVISPNSAKHYTPEAKVLLDKLKTRLEALPEWNHDNIESVIRRLAEDENVKPAAIIHPARYTVSGRTVGPSLFELLEVLGSKRVLRRLWNCR